MRVLLSLVLVPFAALAHPGEFHSFVPEGPTPWTHERILDRGEKFQFAIVTDRTGGMRPGVFEAAVEKLNLLQPAFVMSVGDLIEGNATRDELILQWEEFDGIISQLDMPFFYVPGNHDVSNSEAGRSLWEERVGPLYYHFLYKDVLFICMNSDDDTLATLGDAQIEYVKQALASHTDVRWTFLFYHKPIFVAENSRWDEIEAVLMLRPHTVFSGHRHNYMNYERHTRDYFVLGTTGGGMTHQGLQMGHLDHIVWVTMDEGEPHIANLLLDGILDKDIRPDWAAALGMPLLRNEATPETAVWASPEPWKSFRATLALQNPLDVPIQVIGRVQPSEQLSPSPQRFEINLAPGANEAVQVELTAVQEVRPEVLQAMVIEYAFLVQPPDRDTLLFTTNSRIFFDTRFQTPRLRGEVALDGRLNEMDTLPLRCIEPIRALPNSLEWRGPADASLEFGVARAGEHLYICARIVDDARQAAPGRRPFRQDGLEIRLDARPEAEVGPVPAAEDRTQEHYLYVAVNPLENSDGVFEPEKLPEGVRFVCTPTAEGYVVEGVVPMSYLNERQGRQWESFRLNLTLYDYDEPSDGGSILSWRPDWNTAGGPPPGSGRFYRTQRN